MKRIAFGLSNTLVDLNEENFSASRVRPGAFELLKELKEQGHFLILWTSLKKRKIEFAKFVLKDFFILFDKIYCKEDVEIEQEIPGCSVHAFKNINKINADCLIESKKNYGQYSTRLQMSEKYLIIDKYRECLFNRPSNWKVRVVGEEALQNWKNRMDNKEEWVYDVLLFIEKMKGK